MTAGEIRMKRIAAMLLGVGFLVLAQLVPSHAGLPLNNLEGVGGIAFNPLAYTAGTNCPNQGGPCALENIFSKPQIGAWYIHLGDAGKVLGAPGGLDWGSFGVAETFFKRLEVSYGDELMDLRHVKTIDKNSVGMKLLLVRENECGLCYVPAISVGAIYKDTTGYNIVPGAGIDSTGWDYYVVATKLITQLPLPVLLSAGMISSNSIATGALGYDTGRDQNWFGNFDIIPVKNLAIGAEYKQGTLLDHINNADYWNVHVAWFVDKQLTLVAAYVNAGSATSVTRVGLGEGVTVSAQYQFWRQTPMKITLRLPAK